MNRRAIAIVTGVAVIAAGVLIVRPWWEGRCSASFEKVPVAKLARVHTVPLDQVKVDDFYEGSRENLRNLLEVAQHPVAPLGAARNAVVLPHQTGTAVATLANSNDGDVRFKVGDGGLLGSGTAAAIVQVDGETGKPVWGRRQESTGAGDGDLAGRLVLTRMPRDTAPRITAVETSNGDLAWCTKVGKDSDTDSRWTFASAASGDALFVVRPSDGRKDSDHDVRLARIDARSGKVNWNKRVAGLDQADSVHVLQDQLLLSRLPTDLDDDARSRKLDPDHKSEPPVRDRGAIVARSTSDGTPTWTYRGPDDRGWISNVVGTGKDVAAVISRRSSYQGKTLVNETWLTGIDRTGKQLWKHDFKDQFGYWLIDYFKVAGGLLLSYEKGERPKTSDLVARSLTDGTERWRTQISATASPLRHGASEVLGNSLLANTFDDGLIAVDLGSGAVTNPLPGKKIGPIKGIVSDGRTVTIDANGLFITFNRTS
ncbi:PQQ-binding-like beta-propeller repeat protein [Kribbella sp. NPDC006257]|uniref:outer membrane protein assembly factor BamB family protein n=1 Tax=Kribbella sp. NPDC006257 TaxID=3156738 RepID=UPI0033AF232B